MVWTWNKIVELNRIIYSASEQPHAVRNVPITNENGEIVLMKKYRTVAEQIASEHYFVESNKRAACCLAICQILQHL